MLSTTFARIQKKIKLPIGFFSYSIYTKNDLKSLSDLPSSQCLPQNQFKGTERFFKTVKNHFHLQDEANLVQILGNKNTLKSFLLNLDKTTINNYVYEAFVYWVSKYTSHSLNHVNGYFSGKYDLDSVSKDFIKFCFKHDIHLDDEKTLKSFDYHNRLSDNALKSELRKMQPKDCINLLGYGLDNGIYEKQLAQYLINTGLAKKVTLYGFDPYAQKSSNIQYLSPLELINDKTLSFDIITARWVLHHVNLQERWNDFVNCINKCKPEGRVLVVEHGFLKTHTTPMEKKLYYFLNATFDIIANIGLRPRYFTSTSPNIGSNFFLHYLELKDFKHIHINTKIRNAYKLYDVGPSFPNQTIHSMCRLK